MTPPSKEGPQDEDLMPLPTKFGEQVSAITKAKEGPPTLSKWDVFKKYYPGQAEVLESANMTDGEREDFAKRVLWHRAPLAKKVADYEKALELDEKRVAQDSRRRAALEETTQVLKLLVGFHDPDSVLDQESDIHLKVEADSVWERAQMALDNLDALTPKEKP